MTETTAQVEQLMNENEDRGEALTATLRSSRFDDLELRRVALAHAIDLNIAAFRGLGTECDVQGKGVVAGAELFYDFLRGT